MEHLECGDKDGGGRDQMLREQKCMEHLECGDKGGGGGRDQALRE
jgi:hypothetical protein